MASCLFIEARDLFKALGGAPNNVTVAIAEDIGVVCVFFSSEVVNFFSRAPLVVFKMKCHDAVTQCYSITC
ncbi:hypothetical protein ACLOJK_006145 [Asimina triloba]